MSDIQRQILGLFLVRLELIEQQIEELDRSLGQGLRQYNDAVVRLAQVPGLDPDSA